MSGFTLPKYETSSSSSNEESEGDNRPPPKEYDPTEVNGFSHVNNKNKYELLFEGGQCSGCMVSTVHTGDEEVLKRRKKPRENQFNRKNVRQVWGSNWCANIKIPGCINDYNNMMGGVDKAYQMISNYRPKLRCRRTWMPMFLHSLDVCRLNSYIISCKQRKGGVKNQKDFLLGEWITSMNSRAEFDEQQQTRQAAASITPFITPADGKRKRMSY